MSSAATRRPAAARASLAAAVLTFAACLTLVGCRPLVRLPVLPSTLPTADELLARLASRRETIRSVRGFAQISYESGEDNIGSRHAVLARRPDHFRLEVLSPLGALAVVASDGHDLIVYARRENKIYRGPATPESLARYTAVPVALDDVVDILLGSPPDREPVARASVAREEAAASIRLTVPLTTGQHQVWFAPDTLLPKASATPLPDGRILQVTFDDYRVDGPLAFPHSIDMRAEPGAAAVRVRYASPSLNTQMTDTLFAFPPRPGIEELVIEQYPAAGSQS